MRYRSSCENRFTKRTGIRNTRPLSCIHLRPLRCEMLEHRRLLAVALNWSGPGNALTLTENTSGATPAIVISEPSANISLLKIDLGAGYSFDSTSTTSAMGLTYQNPGSPTTSQYATIDISEANNVSSLVATLPGDGLAARPDSRPRRRSGQRHGQRRHDRSHGDRHL